LGTVYALDEIAAIGASARDARIRFHMDGARLANALVRLKCSASEMTWRLGVDILSFGATKNGAMGTDAIVVFDKELVEPLSYRLRRAGQTWSKMRFAAAQLIAYVQNGLFLRLASRANELASKLGRELAAIPGVRLMAPVEANLLFVALPEQTIETLAAAGLRFARRGGSVIRLVTRFDGTESEVDEFIALVRRSIG
jgi:threonine aldolase